jgi:hypothetical protein
LRLQAQALSRKLFEKGVMYYKLNLMPASSEINFIPNAPKTSLSVKDQIFQWVIKNGKRIVIITQAIVLLVFVSRFKFDNDIRGITSEIEQNQAILESLSDVEDKYIHNQERLALVKPIIERQINWDERLTNFNKKIPDDLILNNVKFDEDQISLDAFTKSPQSFQVFISLLIGDPTIESVILNASEFDTETGEYKLSLTMDLQK